MSIFPAPEEHAPTSRRGRSENRSTLCFSLLMHLTHALFMCERFCDRNLDSRAPIGTEEKLVSYRTDEANDCVNRSRNDLLSKPRQP